MIRGTLACLLVVFFAAGVRADAVLFSEGFGGPGLPNSLDFSTTAAVWSVNGGRLHADNPNTVPIQLSTAVSKVGFALRETESLIYRGQVGTPSTSRAEGYNVGLLFGEYLALFHPGFLGPPAGAFRLERFDGTLPTVGLISNTSMGHLPARDGLHTITAEVRRQGTALKIDITIVGPDPLGVSRTFTSSYLDTSPVFGDGRAGFWMGGQDLEGDDGFFDNLEVRGPAPIPEPGPLALIGAALVGYGVWRRRKGA